MLPHRVTIGKRLKRLHAKHYISLIDSLGKLPFISITTDFWSDLKGISYLVLTGHFINNKMQLKSTILRFSSFSSRHFSENIGVEIQNQLTELNVFDKVTTITCDAAPNMIKMFSYLSRPEITRIRCQAHLLHLIVCNGLSLWVTRLATTDDNNDGNAKDSEERLSQSLRKVNIANFDDEDEGSNGSSDEEQIGNNANEADEVPSDVS